MRWLINIKNDSLLIKARKEGCNIATQNLRLCSQHFDDNQYLNSMRLLL